LQKLEDILKLIPKYEERVRQLRIEGRIKKNIKRAKFLEQKPVQVNLKKQGSL